LDDKGNTPTIGIHVGYTNINGVEMQLGLLITENELFQNFIYPTYDMLTEYVGNL
jgi:hypothetical protein